jgi:transposase
MDETTLSLHFPIRACWMRRGQQKRLPAGSIFRPSYHLIGALQWSSDQVFSQAVEHTNSQTFIQFLEYLLVQCFPTQKVVLVMDNAAYHNSKSVLAALSLFEPRVRVFWLPKYCPTLNPIERFWRHLKDLACANKLDQSLENLAKRVSAVMKHQNQSDDDLRISFLKNYV